MDLLPGKNEQPYETTRAGESKLGGVIAAAAGAAPGLLVAVLGYFGIVEFSFIPDRNFTVFGALVFAAIGAFMAMSKYSGRVREDL
jgi:hypothetical protein